MADDIQQTIESLKALTQNIPQDAEGRRARFRMLQAVGQAVRGMGDRVPQELRDSLYSVLGETEVMLRESELNEERDRNADIEAEARAQLRQRGESGAVVTDRETGALVGVDTGTPIQTPTYAEQPSFAQFEDPRSRTATGRPLAPGGPRASSANFPGPSPTEIDAQQGGGVPQGIAATTAEGVPLSLAPPVDPRGTVDAQTVAGTPRSRRGAAPAAAPTGPQGKVEGPEFPDPYDPRGMYASTGPFDEMRDTFQQEGKIKQEAGLQGAADVMAAAEEIKALRSQAFQQMGEDLVAQEQRLRELDLQLSSLREMRFDSDRLFRNRGHGVSLALGMAVGAMQQTISNILYPGANVPNTAMQLVQDAIDRDLREQAVNYQRAQTEIGMGRTAYEMARQMGMDHTAAYEYAAANSADYVARQLQANRMRMGAGVAAEQMHRAEQELRLQAQLRREAALMAMAQMQAPRVAGGPRQGVGGVPIAPRARLAPGMTAQRAREQIGTQAWNNIQSTLNGGDRVLSILDQMNRIMTSGEGEEYLSRSRGTLESLVGQLTGAIKESMQLGALDNGVIQLREMIIGDPTAVGGMSLWKQRIKGQMQALRAQTARTIESTVRFNGQGLIQHDPTLVVEPNAMPDIPGFEATDEETPASGMEGRASMAVQAVADNPVGAAATVAGGTGLLGQSIQQGMRDLLE